MPQPILPNQSGNIVPDLSRLTTLRQGASGATRAPAQGPSQAHDAADVDASLAKVKSLLAELDQASAEASRSGAVGDAARQKVDDIIASIDAVVAGAKPGGAAGGGYPGFTVENVNVGVRKFSVRDVEFGPSGEVDVNVVITQSAQQAGQFLSFGSFVLDLSASTSQFGIEIEGPLGAIPLTFASGTAVSDFATAVNAFTDQTGVTAIPSATGIRIESTEYGSGEFVSVRILEDGGLNQAEAGAGVYQLAASDATIASAATRFSFDSLSAAEAILDHGQDVAGVINGFQAKGDGFILTVQSPLLHARIALRTGNGLVNAQNLGSMTAFTIVQSEGSAASSLARDVRSSLGLE